MCCVRRTRPPVRVVPMNRQKATVIGLVAGIVCMSSIVHVWLPFYSQASQDKRAVLSKQRRAAYRDGYNIEALKMPITDPAPASAAKGQGPSDGSA